MGQLNSTVDKGRSWSGPVEHQAEADLENFARFVADEGRASGAWRGSINEGATVRTPGVTDAASSWGDSGKVGDDMERETALRDSDRHSDPGVIRRNEPS